jgi:glyceraldehyde 3-phosphate dehydrogenase
MVDLTFYAEKSTSIEEINNSIKEAASGSMSGILTYNSEPLVSIDFNHNPASSNFDATQTQVVKEKLVRVLSWYDNEWGFSNRMADVAVLMGK